MIQFIFHYKNIDFLKTFHFLVTKAKVNIPNAEEESNKENQLHNKESSEGKIYFFSTIFLFI